MLTNCFRSIAQSIWCIDSIIASLSVSSENTMLKIAMMLLKVSYLHILCSIQKTKRLKMGKQCEL